jgi:import inner membrane translocase subunit TIM22
VVEKYRGKHDVVNGASAGFVTGAALAAPQGPQAMAFGAVGFAVFSIIIDYVMGGH